MSVENQVLELLRSKEWVYVDDFEKLFPKGIEGHQSFMQRLRGLRELGYIIDKRKKENCKHTFEYSLINFRIPDADREFKMKNRSKMFRHNLCHLRPESPHTELESSIIHSNLIEESKINRKAFEQKGQMAFLR